MLIVSSCSTSFQPADRWEGIRDNRIRIYVRFTFPANRELDDYEKNAPQFLKTMADDRAFMILTLNPSMRKNASAPVYDSDSIKKIISTGKVLYMLCNDDYCESFTEYSISGKK